MRARAAAADASPNSSSLLLLSRPFLAHLAYPTDERVEVDGEKSLLLCDILGDSGLAASNGLGYRGGTARGGGDGSWFCRLFSLI